MTDKCKTFVARWDHAMCSTCGEEHDRPAPTPTAPPALDLDAVEAAERAMAAGPWAADHGYVTSTAGAVATCIGPDAEHDAAGIVALRNAAPALIAEVRALVEQLAAARAVPADVEAALSGAWADGYDEGRADALRRPEDHHRKKPSTRDATIAWGMTAIAKAIAAARAIAAPPPTVGGLLAAGEERESRAWSEKGKAPPGSCPFCASRISMVQRDGYFIARCSHRGCGAVGPRMRSVSRAADLFCQPPRREAKGMSCGPIVASPTRPRCRCTHEAGDSRCDAHPTCSECGATTARPVDGCDACRGPLPKGG